MDKYKYFPSGKKLCIEHNLEFLDLECPRCRQLHSSIQTKVTEYTDMTIVPIAEIKKVKKEVSSKFHDKSRSIHDKSRRVYQRFHSYRVRYEAEVLWDFIHVEPTMLRNNVQFKRLDFDLCYVLVFRKSVLIVLRSGAEIKGLEVREAKAKADGIIRDIVSRLPSSIKVNVPKVASVHNAFVNHPTALHDVNVYVDGEARLISDRSKGKIEFEAVNTRHAVNDSEILEVWNKDIITNPFDMPSVTKYKLDSILNVQMEYAEQIKKHLKVQDKTLEVMESINTHFSSGAVYDLNPHVRPKFSAQSSRVEEDGTLSPSLPTKHVPSALLQSWKKDADKAYKKFRVNQLLKEYGW